MPDGPACPPATAGRPAVGPQAFRHCKPGVWPSAAGGCRLGPALRRDVAHAARSSADARRLKLGWKCAADDTQRQWDRRLRAKQRPGGRQGPYREWRHREIRSPSAGPARCAGPAHARSPLGWSGHPRLAAPRCRSADAPMPRLAPDPPVPRPARAGARPDAAVLMARRLSRSRGSPRPDRPPSPPRGCQRCTAIDQHRWHEGPVRLSAGRQTAQHA